MDVTGRQPRILVVEDQTEVRQLVSSMIHTRGFACRAAASLTEARAAMARERPDIVLLDVTLPDGSGLSLVERGGEEGPLAVVITGLHDIDTAVEALRRGAVDFVAKPFSVGDLFARIDRAVAQWRARERLRSGGRTLAELVRRTTDDLARTRLHIEEARDAVVVTLATALDLKDHETEDHRRRVAENAARLGRELGMGDTELRDLRRGAYLHDIGNIGVPERILFAAGDPGPDDRRILEQHPAMGCRILGTVEFLAGAADVVRCHHERWDGAGYPARMVDSAIPFAARVFAIADALDDITAARPEHRPRPFSAFTETLRDGAARRFDPRIVEAALAMGPGAWLLSPETPGTPAAAHPAGAG